MLKDKFNRIKKSLCEKRKNLGNKISVMLQGHAQKKLEKQEAVNRDIKKRQSAERKFTGKLADNPYLQTRALWNDMYGDVESRLKKSQKLNFLLGGCVAIALVGLIMVASQSKIKPYPFIVRGHEVINVSEPAVVTSSLKERLAPYFAENFIRAARQVSADGQVNALNKIRAYSLVNGPAKAVLSTFFKKNNPDVIAKQHVKNITITSILRETHHALEIHWREDWRRTESGKLVQTKYYIAKFVYAFNAPSQNEIILQHNPLGFWVTALSWSETRQHGDYN